MLCVEAAAAVLPIHPQPSSQSSVSVCCDSHLTTTTPTPTPTPLQAQPLDTRYYDKDYGKQRFQNPKTSQQDISSRESRELLALVPPSREQLHLFCSTIPQCQCNAVANESPGFAVITISMVYRYSGNTFTLYYKGCKKLHNIQHSCGIFAFRNSKLCGVTIVTLCDSEL